MKKNRVPAASDELVTYDLFLRYEDKDGRAHVRCHRVWDGERFFKSQLDTAKRERGTVELISETDYQRGRR